MAFKKNPAKPEPTTQLSLELDSKKHVTVRQFNGVNLVDIREFYVDSATQEKKPGKKGISLTEDVWRKLVEASGDISNALAALGGNPPAAADGPDKKRARMEPKKEPETEGHATR